ncbi:hypothetical protein ACQ3I4_00520 [Zafaria sp. Z1313]|uniref:hypothetical protein n=1 Tax=unclassified Zafaria TaxID=2828765 RepID=UPI002E75B3B8|nr:hypothetical protein [Zafaria sp. J156]MEE1619864.1 hypothetical protein [Zafaria sp. J156]
MTTTVHDALTASPWAGRLAPATPGQWLDRAREVATILSTDAVERDRAGAAPTAEVRLL